MLGLRAAACSRLRQFAGGWMRFGKPVGGRPVRSGAIRTGRRYTPSTQTRREWVEPGRPWLPPLLWRRPVTQLASYGKTMVPPPPCFWCTKLSRVTASVFLSPSPSPSVAPPPDTLSVPPPVSTCCASICLTTWSKRVASRNGATEKSLEVTVATLELRLAPRKASPS